MQSCIWSRGVRSDVPCVKESLRSREESCVATHTVFGHSARKAPNMAHLFDEFSKSLPETLPRRESLRRLGVVFAGAILSPLGLETAWAGRKAPSGPDPCLAFCKCRNKRQQDQCLKICRASQSDTSRVCGSCGSYVGCAAGQRCCSGHCTDLQNDANNCGGCGRSCAAPHANESVACVSGLCTYDCVPGAVDCNGTCTFLESDPDNCGACGNVCPAATPFCTDGACTDVFCNGADLLTDYFNCGECGNICYGFDYCLDGVCQSDPNPVGGY